VGGGHSVNGLLATMRVKLGGGFLMNDQETKGKIEQAKGKIREEVGKLTGDESEQLKGKIEQVKGKVQEEVGKAKKKLDNDH